MSTRVAALELSAAEIAELKTAYKQERDRRIAERIHCIIFLPAYAPNLNLIERLWRFVKDEVLSDAYYATFAEFTAAIEKVLDHLDQYADRLAKLMTEKFEILACV